MPSANRRRFVEIRTRQGFEKGRNLTSAQEIAFQIALAEFQLDTVREQASHLTKLHHEGHLKNA
jgi:Complex 1 protein (LYR family)